jgi:MFS family permease
MQIQQQGISDSTAESGEKKASMRTVVAASAIGTTIEWYDFLIYSTAASLVLNKLFFPTRDPLVGKLLAIGTIGVGFFVRPLGAVILSHFGDRMGRKSMLVLTLVNMGVGTVLIGLLPTYETIGVAAPILLMFPSNLRYSGASLGYQLAAPIGGGLVPVIAAAIAGRNHGATWPVSILMIALALITMVAVLYAKETAPALAKSHGRPGEG